MPREEECFFPLEASVQSMAPLVPSFEGGSGNSTRDYSWFLKGDPHCCRRVIGAMLRLSKKGLCARARARDSCFAPLAWILHSLLGLDFVWHRLAMIAVLCRTVRIDPSLCQGVEVQFLHCAIARNKGIIWTTLWVAFGPSTKMHLCPSSTSRGSHHRIPSWHQTPPSHDSIRGCNRSACFCDS
ncbi:hypothetical protein IE81DRAFT_25435 [Ceraceosorus guamensis]|uniref:Uncharacterized protein n=1 Tax=Ceraceosorus guamensis TaxID=1522189 RepID=A0A316VQ45_9BASI|nr:hypothetical protein IE81DRAFT_25435 [Ceraceosorus guamensis]PWN39450.1 hypothetical protein IE81DRAFT_25435 [Ceraceosorus guamensis]